MKRIVLLTLLLTSSLYAVVLYTSCKKDKCKDTQCLNGGSCNDGTCTCPTGYTGTHCETALPGQVAFFVTSAVGGDINVTMNGETHKVSAVFPGGRSGCGIDGCATFSAQPGTYHFTASNSTRSWNGDLTIKAGKCFGYELPNLEGSAVFWTPNAHGVITITVGGQSGYITSTVTNTPACGASGCFTVTLPIGPYTYTASSSMGDTWNGSISIVNGCSTLRLN